MDTINRQFTLDKSTKNTHRYAEVTDGEPVIGKLYVNKSQFNGVPPNQIEVTVEESSKE